MTDQTLDVFISRKSEDAKYAKPIYDYLTKQGLNVFESDHTLKELGNANYIKAIDAAIEETNHLIVIASSKEYINSSWVEAEWLSFLRRKRSGKAKGNLFTVICDGMQIDDVPASLQNYEVIQYKEMNFPKVYSYCKPLINPLDIEEEDDEIKDQLNSYDKIDDLEDKNENAQEELKKIVSSPSVHRIISFFIDLIVIAILISLIFFIGIDFLKRDEESDLFFSELSNLFYNRYFNNLTAFYLITFTFIFYYTFLEHFLGKSLGKFLSKCQVINCKAQKARFINILGRNILKFIFCFLGFGLFLGLGLGVSNSMLDSKLFMTFVTLLMIINPLILIVHLFIKRSIYDRIANTYVVNDDWEGIKNLKNITFRKIGWTIFFVFLGLVVFSWVSLGLIVYLF